MNEPIASPAHPMSRLLRTAADVLLEPTVAFQAPQRGAVRAYTAFLLLLIAAISAMQWPYKQAAFHIEPHRFWQILAATLIVAPVVTSIVVWLVYALVLWCVTTLFGSKFSFRQALQVTVTSATVVVLGALLNAVMLFLFLRPGTINSVRQLAMVPDLNSFLHLTGRLAGAADVFTPFSIWFFALLGVGVWRLTGMHAKRAAAVAVLVCAVGTVVSAGLHGR